MRVHLTLRNGGALEEWVSPEDITWIQLIETISDSNLSLNTMISINAYTAVRANDIVIVRMVDSRTAKQAVQDDQEISRRLLDPAEKRREDL